MLALLLYLAVGQLGTAAAAVASCDLTDSDKVDCGEVGIDQGGCEAKGCCWQPVSAAAANINNNSVYAGRIFVPLPNN